MSGEAHAPLPPLPSVFISYASDDRAAARLLRDTLAAAGLEVWLDEDELGGGEAWDAKIRNQIRSCTYFMPVISATTEIRREGYFRREWRFAVERTLDLADDVLFLVPVVIDDTRDTGARVPEKFFAVQWLRVPGGRPTPALQDLARKLVTGETAAPAPVFPAAPAAGRKARRATEPPPPFPKFPAFPEPGHRLRFCYNLVLWGGHLLHSLWGHLPRFVRVIAAMVIIFNLIAWVFRESQTDGTIRKRKSDVAEEVTKALDAVQSGTAATPETDKAAAVIESVVGATADALQSGRPLAVVNFSGEGEGAQAYARNMFTRVCKLLQTGEHPQFSISPLPLRPGTADLGAVNRGARLNSRFVLTGHVRANPPGRAVNFVVKLFDVKSGQLAWTESYDSTGTDAATVAEKVVAEVRQRCGPVPAEK